jgi:hypothetical protein
VGNAIKLIRGHPGGNRSSRSFDGAGGDGAGGSNCLDFLGVIHVITNVVAWRCLSHIFWWDDRGSDSASGAKGAGNHHPARILWHNLSLKERREMADTPGWWFNNKTGDVEFGPQSLGMDRDGPFETEAEAARAPEIARERSQAWTAEEENS